MAAWLGSLALVVIGTLIGMIVERLRWKRSRRDKLDEARRQAIVAALAWSDPMYSALMTAESQMFALLRDFGKAELEDEAFRERYPDLIPTLSKLDLTLENRLLVPSGTYERGF